MEINDGVVQRSMYGSEERMIIFRLILTLVGTLIISDINLYEPIHSLPIENRTYDTSELNYGANFLEGTSWNDLEWGRTVIIGHTPGAFENLIQLEVGDRIILLTDLYSLEYYVGDIRVVAVEDTSWLMPTSVPTLTLITCYGNQRLVINAYFQ